jgi:hypothetical protein
MGAFSIAGGLARKAAKAGVPIFYTADTVPNFANYTGLIRNEYESVEDLDDITRTLSLYYYLGGKKSPSPTQVY